MMMDTTIYGYVGDGAVYHDEHIGDLTQKGEELAGLSPLYSHDDDGNGLSCDECGEWIFEPTFEAVWESADLGDVGYRQYGTADDLWATVDYPNGSEDLVIEGLDVDSGQAFGAFLPGTRAEGDQPLVIWATPDHPLDLEHGEV